MILGLLLIPLLNSCDSPSKQLDSEKWTPANHSVSGDVVQNPVNRDTLGWDLTYKTLLTRNNIAPDEWIWKWLGPNYESPVKPLIASWKHEPIESAVLIEMPAPHAGEHVTMWFVRTKTKGYYFDQVEQEEKPPHKTTEALDPQAYDKFFSVVSSWEQGKPVKPENTPNGGVPGYDGILSLYNRGTSRQMLLTIEDFAICNDKMCNDWKPGRLTQAMNFIPRFKVG